MPVEKLLQIPEFYAPVSSGGFEGRKPSVPNPALEGRDRDPAVTGGLPGGKIRTDTRLLWFLHFFRILQYCILYFFAL
jgi:hypothetical protein